MKPIGSFTGPNKHKLFAALPLICVMSVCLGGSARAASAILTQTSSGFTVSFTGGPTDDSAEVDLRKVGDSNYTYWPLNMPRQGNFTQSESYAFSTGTYYVVVRGMYGNGNSSISTNTISVP